MEANAPETRNNKVSRLDASDANETNKVKLFLEANLGRKVEIENITFNKDKRDYSKNEVSYKVWLYTHDVIEDARGRLKVAERTLINKAKNEIVFKVGMINYDDLRKKQMAGNKTTSGNSTNRDQRDNRSTDISTTNKSGPKSKSSFTAVLASINVSKVETLTTEESPETVALPKYTDCYYICQDKAAAPGEENEHWFGVRDMSRVFYHAIVDFRVEEGDTSIVCCGCNKSSAAMVYCHNDKKFFCLGCDENFHVKSTFNTVRKHRRTNYLGYSAVYGSSCAVHQLKPMDYYCLDCKAVYCHKCLLEKAGAEKAHDVRFIGDYLPTLEEEAKSLSERVDRMHRHLVHALGENERGGREVQKTLHALEADLHERHRKAVSDLEQETLTRNAFLASVSIELQRIYSEIEAKTAFLKNQFNNADNATYIHMARMMNSYLTNELFNNLDILLEVNLEKIADKMYEWEQKSLGVFGLGGANVGSVNNGGLKVINSPQVIGELIGGSEKKTDAFTNILHLQNKKI